MMHERVEPDTRESRHEGGLPIDLLAGEITLQVTAAVNNTEATDLDADEARTLIGQARQHYAVLKVIAEKLYFGRAWIALGYESWDDLCAVELGGSLSLPRSEREEFHVELAESGMSNRAIAAVTGVDEKTVRNDRKAGAENSAPEPPDPDDEIVDAEIVEDTPEPAVANNVIGIDGKKYPTPKPAADRRRTPITKTAERLAYDIELMARRVRRFAEDDRVRSTVDRDGPIFKRLDRATDGLTEELSNLEAAVRCTDEAWDDWREKFMDDEEGAS